MLREAVDCARENQDDTFDTNKLRSGLFDDFAHFQGARMGSYIKGRKSGKTRFLSLPDASKDLVAGLKRAAPRDSDAREKHQPDARRRSDLPLSFALPSDWSRPEAARLARFIEALPFDA